MTPVQTDLWQRLNAFSLDEAGASFPYSRKLAREHHWSHAYTLRVIHEYRRFVLLAMTAGHPVSPSDAVDQAWHLHLTYTRSYWHGLCQQVLGKPLHHEPSRGGSDESAKFTSWYAQTLASYRTIFGEEPPSDIWPHSVATAPRRRRINLERTWALPKPRHLAWTGACAVLLLCVLLAGGCVGATDSGTSLFDLRGPAFLSLFIKIWLVCFAVALFLRLRHWRMPATALPADAVSSDPYWHAWLAGGASRATAVAISTLGSRGNIDVSRGTELKLQRKTAPDASTHPVARDLWENLPETGSMSFKSALARVGQTCAPITADLETKGLLLTSSGRSRTRWRPLLIALIPVLLGVVKIGVGLQREKPVGFLVILCIFATALALAAFARPVRLTRRGKHTLADLKKHHGALEKQATPDSPALLPLSVALFGTTVLSAYGYAGLEKTLRPLQTNQSGSDGGSGCGSTCGGDGGGGDGGGGCGGCGGGGD